MYRYIVYKLFLVAVTICIHLIVYIFSHAKLLDDCSLPIRRSASAAHVHYGMYRVAQKSTPL